MKIALTLVTTAVLTLSACGDDGPGAAPATSVVTVEILNSRFSERDLSVPAGTTVRFVNRDGFAHTVTSKEGTATSFDSGDLGLDETFDVVFDDAGDFKFFCQIHPTMRGDVAVE